MQVKIEREKSTDVLRRYGQSFAKRMTVRKKENHNQSITSMLFILRSNRILPSGMFRGRYRRNICSSVVRFENRKI